jgi:hypothetical protein
LAGHRTALMNAGMMPEAPVEVSKPSEIRIQFQSFSAQMGMPELSGMVGGFADDQSRSDAQGMKPSLQ